MKVLGCPSFRLRALWHVFTFPEDRLELLRSFVALSADISDTFTVVSRLSYLSLLFMLIIWIQCKLLRISKSNKNMLRWCKKSSDYPLLYYLQLLLVVIVLLRLIMHKFLAATQPFRGRLLRASFH